MTKTCWRDILKIHPAADLFPLMEPNEPRALGENIVANRVQMPIVIWYPGERRNPKKLYLPMKDALLLDGRNRLDAIELFSNELVDDEYRENLAALAAVSDANTRFYSEHEIPNPYAYVISANIHRRHLTAAQKGEVIEALLKAKPERSDRATAKIAQVDHKTVAAKREGMEARGEIPHVETRTDTKGCSQPATKPPLTPH